MEVSTVAASNLAYTGDLAGLQAAVAASPKVVSKVDEDGRRPLHWASSAGHDDCVEALLTARADPHDQDETGWTPLHIAVSAGHRAAIFRLLPLSEVDAVTDNGCTALHYAASKGRVEVVTELLAAGASVNASDKRSESALHRAAAIGNIPTIEALIKGGAAVMGKNAQLETPLHVSFSFPPKGSDPQTLTPSLCIRLLPQEISWKQYCS